MSQTTVALIPQSGYVGIGVGLKRAQFYFPYILFPFLLHGEMWYEHTFKHMRNYEVQLRHYKLNFP